jgi:hypothetical protein
MEELNVYAITIDQPHANLVVYDAKRLETRSWKRESIVGQVIAIHAAKTKKYMHLVPRYPFSQIEILGFPRGCIIGIARVKAIHEIMESGVVPPEAKAAKYELDFGDYDLSRGRRWAWELEGVVRLECPVECKGALGLWRVPVNIDREIRCELFCQ